MTSALFWGFMQRTMVVLRSVKSQKSADMNLEFMYWCLYLRFRDDGALAPTDGAVFKGYVHIVILLSTLVGKCD